jgi:hypothetical protein
VIHCNRLETEKKELLSRKAKLTKENEAKKAKLDELEKQLETILEVRALPPCLSIPCRSRGRTARQGRASADGELLRRVTRARACAGACKESCTGGRSGKGIWEGRGVHPASSGKRSLQALYVADEVVRASTGRSGAQRVVQGVGQCQKEAQSTGSTMSTTVPASADVLVTPQRSTHDRKQRRS